jgi:hypothetical protein
MKKVEVKRVKALKRQEPFSSRRVISLTRYE